ncbi:L-lysine 2,3-aminomutase [Inmirania thermothiophila]|uniref:L-lysine 2,3-aminomutase n=2 Tax=Inmirania thermothiophila TaxID=1750597 RepID=A0A3N1Y8U5_9GAMM|nr:L-lysine 2,3-aminomutase [Inmirania thermothiophila]
MTGAAPAVGDWRRALAAALRTPEALRAAAGLGAPAEAERAAAADFPVRVTATVLERIRRGDPADPVLAQFLPAAAELAPVPGFVDDPVGDLAARRGPGLLQKYRGRLLVMPTTACAVHCRYCFRRHYPHRDGARPEAVAARLRADPGLHEVILSGGDPLVLPDPPLRRLLAAVDGVATVRRIRIHTRVPVVLPARIGAPLVAMLSALRARCVVVLHVNHAAELGPDAAAALAALRGGGVVLLNQAVLLRGVNDSVPALAALSEALLDHGVLPYYLHQLDPVRGAAHFGVPDAEALALHRALRARLPGYLVPRLVREVPGDAAKRELAAAVEAADASRL